MKEEHTDLQSLHEPTSCCFWSCLDDAYIRRWLVLCFSHTHVSFSPSFLPGIFPLDFPPFAAPPGVVWVTVIVWRYQTPNYDQLNKGPLPSQNNSASGARHYPQANISWISCSQTISFMLILAQTCGETPGEALSSNGFYREIRFNQILNRKKLSSVRCSSLCFSTVVTRVQSFGSKQLFFLCCVSVSSLKTSNRANPITSATETHWGQGLYQIRVIKPCPELLLQSNTC